MKYWILTLLFIVSRSSRVFAEGNDSPLGDGDGASYFPALLQLIFTLGIILGLLYIVFRFISKRSGIYGNPNFKHLGGLPLGQNKSVQLVEVNNKVYILGVGENIQLIQKIDEPEEVLAIKASNQSSFDEKMNWKDWINRFKESSFNQKWNLKWFDNKGVGTKKQDFEQILTGKMKELKERRNENIEQIFDGENTIEKERDHHD